jgi:hypothetical protein
MTNVGGIGLGAQGRRCGEDEVKSRTESKEWAEEEEVARLGLGSDDSAVSETEGSISILTSLT